MSWATAKPRTFGAIILSVEELNKPRPQYPEGGPIRPVAQEKSHATPCTKNVDGIDVQVIPLTCERRDIVTMRLVADRYKVTPEELVGRSRLHRVVMARIIFCVLMRNVFHWTFERIGKTLDRHHSTVLYYVVEGADTYRHEIEAVRRELVEKGLL